MLTLVPTPIGNLEDISFRAIEVLKSADLILAEDTRHSKTLFQKYNINVPVRSYHAHNEHKIVRGLVDELKSGMKMALVTDAGTPGISDPGFLLVRACHESEIKVYCLPGSNAIIPAVAASGIPSDKFFFEGFLPHKKGRQTRLQFLSDLEYTFVLYESPFRLVKCLEQLIDHCGPGRLACVSREISKIHEEHKRAPLQQLCEYYKEQNVKGEIVIVVSGKE